MLRGHGVAVLRQGVPAPRWTGHLPLARSRARTRVVGLTRDRLLRVARSRPAGCVVVGRVASIPLGHRGVRPASRRDGSARTGGRRRLRRIPAVVVRQRILGLRFAAEWLAPGQWRRHLRGAFLRLLPLHVADAARSPHRRDWQLGRRTDHRQVALRRCARADRGGGGVGGLDRRTTSRLARPTRVGRRSRRVPVPLRRRSGHGLLERRSLRHLPADPHRSALRHGPDDLWRSYAPIQPRHGAGPLPDARARSGWRPRRVGPHRGRRAHVPGSRRPSSRAGTTAMLRWSRL